MAFAIAAIAGCGVGAFVEDTFFFATGASFRQAWRMHPSAIFAGGLAFIAGLYFLQRLNDRPHAIEYVQPYVPFLGVSGINLAVKWNPVWLVPVAVGCVTWSAIQVRRLRQDRLAPRRIRP